MPLSDSTVRHARAENGRPRKFHDHGGLYLFCTPAGPRKPNGSRLWRCDYQRQGKRRTLSFGPYPAVTLADARQRRDEARRMLAEGRDPTQVLAQRKADARQSSDTSFKAIAEEYVGKIVAEGRASATLRRARWLLGTIAYPKIGDLPIDEITAPEILRVLRSVESKGHYETAGRLKSMIGRVCRFAVVTGRATNDPTAALAGALVRPKTKHRSAILEPQKIGELLRAIDGYSGAGTTKAALQLLAHTFVRPGEMRSAEWAEIDLEAALWVIPAEKTKMRRAHHVPLSRQAIAILRELRQVTGNGRYLFPAQGNRNKFMSENTANQALRRMGFSGDTMVAHGFRALAATRLNELGRWSPDVIERQLAHAEKNAVRRAYDRSQHWAERVAMMQSWSDYLNMLRDSDIL